VYEPEHTLESDEDFEEDEFEEDSNELPGEVRDAGTISDDDVPLALR
jgi:hypothetical protein